MEIFMTKCHRISRAPQWLSDGPLCKGNGYDVAITGAGCREMRFPLFPPWVG